MKNLFKFGTKATSVPATIDNIVDSFEKQIIELDARIAYDTEIALTNKATADALLIEAANKEADIDRSNRIKSKIADIIK